MLHRPFQPHAALQPRQPRHVLQSGALGAVATCSPRRQRYVHVRGYGTGVFEVVEQREEGRLLSSASVWVHDECWEAAAFQVRDNPTIGQLDSSLLSPSITIHHHQIIDTSWAPRCTPGPNVQGPHGPTRPLPTYEEREIGVSPAGRGDDCRHEVNPLAVHQAAQAHHHHRVAGTHGPQRRCLRGGGSTASSGSGSGRTSPSSTAAAAAAAAAMAY